MSIYKIIVDNRNYSSWTIYETIHYKPITEFELKPIENKLFSNDFFKWNKEKKIEIVHSSIRSGTFIPGVLILEGSKTYGRKNGRLLYKCIPDDMRLPSFLIPYEVKKVGFTKIFLNIYVTFQFTDWEDKHPYGQLNQVIGEVDKLDNFYEYQLYCKSLNASIQKFQKDTMKSIQNKPHDAFIENIQKKYPSIEDRTSAKDWFIFSIDPEKSLDFDDAFSIKKNDININTSDSEYILSIYISNVTIWIDVLNLWDSFSRRISTIYLPDRKRPMLPTILSDCLCSLQSKNTRIALAMDIFMNKDCEIKDISFTNCTIRVNKNFVYEEPELLVNKNYLELLEKTRILSKKFKYLSSIRDSHDLVSYLMIFMNYHCAKEMMKHNNGIFRSTIVKKDFDVPPNKVPEEVGKFIKIWKSTSGQYIDGTKLIKEQNLRHDLLDLDAYIHITSPIRRLVDLLNMIQLQKNLGLLNLSEKSQEFYQKWLDDLDYINTTMRFIRKVQMDCSLLDLCYNTPGMMEKEFDGYVFDKLERDDGLFQFIVFLPELKLSSRITMRDNVENYEKKKFHLYLFHDEESFKKKIRLHLL
jgi:exoribonuclease R